MSERVFVFVDESGNHTRTDLYVVSGCWCFTTYTDVNRVLQPTKNRLSDNVVHDADGPSIGREIKGAEMGHRKLDSAFAYLRKVGGMDGSITTTGLPWDDSCPIRFTTCELDSDLGTELARTYLGEGRSHVTSQVVGLVTLVSPLLRLESLSHRPIDSFHVVLDSETWRRPSRKVRGLLDGLDGVPEVEFECFDSESVPGIQLADVAAHVRRQRLRNGNCERASEALDEMRL